MWTGTFGKRRGKARQAAQHLRLARRRARQRGVDRPRGGAIQEHKERLLPQREQPRPAKGRHRGGGSQPWPRHRRGDAHGQARKAADKEGQPEVGRRHKACLPNSEVRGHGEIQGRQKPRARNDDTEPANSQKPRTATRRYSITLPTSAWTSASSSRCLPRLSTCA